MAAPTNIRVWAIGQTATVLKWVYSGTAAVGIYRSTNGSTYTLVETVQPATLIYSDTELTPGTKYWYKVSDDVGSTFSSVVTVKTHACGDTVSGRRRGFALPRFRKSGSTTNKQNRMARDIEDVIEKRTGNQEPCVACIEDGAIVIDCSQDCDCWDVDASTDINSITFLNCDGVDPCINFRVPPGTTVGICGFPQGHSNVFSFGGDECTEAPVNGGTAGRTMTTGKQPPRSKPGSGKTGGGAGGSGCECIPGTKNQLTVKCCSSGCSMNCATTKSLQVKICGGTAPYSITGSAGLTFTKQGGGTVSSGITAGSTVIVRPPTNSGSGVAGNAYKTVKRGCDPLGLYLYSNTIHKCDDSIQTACDSPIASGTPAAILGCTNGLGDFAMPLCEPAASPITTCSGGGKTLRGYCNCTGATPLCVPDDGGALCDVRTAPMIAAGCNPCGVSSGSKTITVTDAQGVSVVTTLNP